MKAIYPMPKMSGDVINGPSKEGPNESFDKNRDC